MRVKTRSLPTIINTDSMFRSAPQIVTESAKTDSEFQNVRELRLKLETSQEENLKLQAVITDLTQVNKRWQKYNNDRQIYVQKLLNTIQDQQEQLNLIAERSFASSTSQNLSSSETDVQRLRMVEQKLKEKISILEFQVKAHRDDWEAELNEKKQALKDKEAVEHKLAELLSKMPGLPTGGEQADCQVELYCQHCGRVSEFDTSPPSHSRMYRTAVHLPCSSSRHSSSTSLSTMGDELVIDSRRDRDRESSSGCSWNIRPEPSYSRCSTVPLVSPPPPAPVIQSEPPHTVKSFVQIPIAKSSSVPEGGVSKYPELPRMSLDSFKCLNVPPVTTINSAEQYSGTETSTAEDVICLRCGEVFPPSMHLKFLDHFPKCQSTRSPNLVSRDGTPK